MLVFNRILNIGEGDIAGHRKRNIAYDRRKPR
jgi:hypothetical protein